MSDKLKEFFENNKKVFIWIGVGVALLVLLGAGISSCSMFTSTGSSVIASSYLSEDDAMLGAEAQYCRMEQELQSYLDTYESTHNYDEYHFDLDDIEHDPYVLISILSALHEGEFTLDEVQGTLQMLFEKQYILTEEVIVETRYRTETDTWTDADGNTHTETYRVPYDYYICNVKLENFNLSHVPVYIMSQEQLSMYATYMSVLGNREDLFGDSPYVDKYITNPPADYDVNPEYLNDERFATLITEAEKYLGYPYVWGGSNPDTSFDCSGFVSYVLTNSGLVNTGRLGAQGLYNVCTPVSKANAQPGDLIFFVGTYDTPGVSHVGIYVGDGVMIHCGDADKTYDDVFHHVITRGPHKGEVRGFAWAGMCAVNRDCKIPPVRKYNTALSPDTVSYVGIARDEPKRLARLDGVKKVSLLAKYGMTEADAYKLCQEHGLLSPIYAHCRRNGCWFCPNASDSELLHMVTKHPDMFDRLIEWENEDNIFHRRMTRRETPSEVKARLLSKSQTGFSSPKSK